MPRYQFTEPETAMTQGSTGQDVFDILGRALDLVVRAVGLVLLGIGFWMALSVVAEAWALYRKPDNGRVELVAAAIAKASNLDQILVSRPQPKRRKPTPTATPQPAGEAATADSDDSVDRVAAELAGAVEPELEIDEESAPLPPLKLSYFCAWFVVLSLLGILGHLSLLAIRVGGALALRSHSQRNLG